VLLIPAKTAVSPGANVLRIVLVYNYCMIVVFFKYVILPAAVLGVINDYY